jgi:hypothetical protein
MEEVVTIASCKTTTLTKSSTANQQWSGKLAQHFPHAAFSTQQHSQCKQQC